ncbi:MAG: Re/Si-specific NAD(P)(+) transhydrogenase subunit alpha [bacterium]|nr:Re/Si-specific NAD(P)(+) transhydrogenase subunit alpha [bacterium]
MIVAVPKDRPGERRVALSPDGAKTLVRQEIVVRVQSGAGAEAGFSDAAYEKVGAKIETDPVGLLEQADVVLRVGAPTAEERAHLAASTVWISLLRPLDEPQEVKALAETGATAFSLEMVPRITRAQSMDVLSSQATVAGYRAVLLAAERLPKMFPMLVTAAGTISPARVFVIGAGVAGLQAIATAKRLGAVVEAYDTRAAAAEQVESLGAKFVVVELDAGDAEDAGGYAREQTEEFYAAQRKLMADRAAASDVVITTALVPGRPAPQLLDEDGVRGMSPGSVVVDLAAPNGGNCAGTRPGETADVNGVQVIGPLNLAGELPTNASQMFSKNAVTFLQNLLTDGELAIDLEDEIVVGSLVAKDGAVVHPVILEKLEGGR